MISLIRFFDEEKWAEDFLDGNLYMNSIGHFWKAGIESKNDFMEGVGEALSPEDFEKQYGSVLSEAFGNHIIGSIQNRVDVFKYVHVLCLLMHEYDPIKHEAVQVSLQMVDMGKYTIRINNVEAFVDRLFDKLFADKKYGLMGPVKYHAFGEKSGYRDCFDKMDRFSYQKEWRFALIPDYENVKRLAEENADYDEHIYYSIGSLHDIAERVDRDILLRDSGAAYKDSNGRRFKTVSRIDAENAKLLKKIKDLGLPITYDADPEQYVGWGPREAFRKKILEIDGSFKPIFAIG